MVRLGWLFIICCPGCSVHRCNVLIYALCGGMCRPWWWDGSGGGTPVRGKSSNTARSSKITKRAKGGNWLDGPCNGDDGALWLEGPWQPDRAKPQCRVVGSAHPPPPHPPLEWASRSFSCQSHPQSYFRSAPGLRIVCSEKCFHCACARHRVLLGSGCSLLIQRERENGEFLRWSVTSKTRERRKRSTAVQWTISLAVVRTAGTMRPEAGRRTFFCVNPHGRHFCWHGVLRADERKAAALCVLLGAAAVYP